MVLIDLEISMRSALRHAMGLVALLAVRANKVSARQVLVGYKGF